MAAFERELGADLEEADLVERSVDAFEFIVEADAVVFDLEHPFVFISEESNYA